MLSSAYSVLSKPMDRPLMFRLRGRPPGELPDPSRMVCHTGRVCSCLQSRPCSEGQCEMALAGLGCGNSLVVSKGVKVGESQKSEERLLQIACPSRPPTSANARTWSEDRCWHRARPWHPAPDWVRAGRRSELLEGQQRTCCNCRRSSCSDLVRNGVRIGEITREGNVENWVVEGWLRLLSRGNGVIAGECRCGISCWSRKRRLTRRSIRNYISVGSICEYALRDDQYNNITNLGKRLFASSMRPALSHMPRPSWLSLLQVRRPKLQWHAEFKPRCGHGL
ncbi:hypothetical protein KC367_g40 [Hortaea werneckii]|nr:hypothetical protein KC367_g40 [Hortaea werneckii]